MHARLAPELTVSDLQQSLRFWRNLLGFEVRYSREDEGFAFLSRDGLDIMLEQQSLAARSWTTADLTQPFGRGINFEITLQAIEPVRRRLEAAHWPFFMPPEVKSYRVGDQTRTVRQWLVQDPDGYLLRFAEVIAET